MCITCDAVLRSTPQDLSVQESVTDLFDAWCFVAMFSEHHLTKWK